MNGHKVLFDLAHINIESPDPAWQNKQTIHAALRRGQVVCFNELKEAAAHAALKAAKGFDCYIHGENAIAWDAQIFELVASGNHVVMHGGHVGADGLPGGADRRRVGPSRTVAWAVLRHKASGKLVIIATHHAVAKADTSQKWRRDLRDASFDEVGAVLHEVHHEHHAPMLLTGDMNTIGRIRIDGMREVKTPPTYGHFRYDRIFQLQAHVRDVRTFRTHSDHLGLSAKVAA